MRLALVQLYSEEQSPTSAPYSIEVLGGHVRAKLPEWQTRLFTLDNRDSADIDALIEEVISFGSQVVGISMMQGTHTVGCALLDKLYARTDAASRAPQVIVGNTLPTYRPEVYLERYPGLLVVRGYGEVPLEEALRTYTAWDRQGRPPEGPDFSSLPGIALHRDGATHRTPVVWSRDYAVPTWVDPQKFFARVETSRGCQHDHCTFCTRPPREPGQPHWVRFPIDPIVDTIRRLRDHGVTRFTFCDEDFIGGEPDFCFELADRLEEMGSTLSFSFSTRADNIIDLNGSDADNERRLALIKRLRDVGLSLLFVGCESFCDRQLKRFAKRTKAYGNIRAMQILNEIGLAVEAGFIMFDPFASLEDLRENIDNLDRYELWKIASQTLSRIDVQANSPLAKWVARDGLLGEYDFNTMTYGYRFQDPLVQKIADWCQEWKDETDNAYRLVRNAQRMALFDEFPNHVMEVAKKLNFTFVKRVTETAAISLDRVPAVIADMKAQRHEVIDAMSEALHSPRVHSDLAERLRQEISGFLGAMDLQPKEYTP